MSGASAVRLESARLTAEGFRHGFATREGGVSEGTFASLSFAHGKEPEAAIEENLRRLAETVGFDPEALVEVSQVHGARVIEGQGDRQRLRREEADAVVVRGGAAAGVRIADCVPVLVGDRETGAAAAIHAGWRGIVAGVISRGVNAMGGRGTDKVAAIGPCIGACCFEVGPDVARTIAAVVGDEGVITRSLGAKAFVDLRRAARARLLAAGLQGANVEDVQGCTRCDGARFHSYRRDGEASGRHLAVIVSRAIP